MEKYLVKTDTLGESVYKLYRFDNGYGALVYEGRTYYDGIKIVVFIRVIRWLVNDFELVYDTCIPVKPVLYDLSDEDVQKTLLQIQELESK